MISRVFVLLFILTIASAKADVAGFQILAELNLARTQPQRYAEIIADRVARYSDPARARSGREAIQFLRKAKALPALTWSPGIGQAALSHALDLGPRGGNGHRNARGEMPWERMERFGKWQGHAGENIDYGNSDARSIVVSLIVDHGVSSRMHRKNIFNRNFRVTGIAVAPHTRARTMCVMDFATGFIEAGEERVATRGPGFRSEYSGRSFF